MLDILIVVDVSLNAQNTVFCQTCDECRLIKERSGIIEYFDMSLDTLDIVGHINR